MKREALRSHIQTCDTCYESKTPSELCNAGFSLYIDLSEIYGDITIAINENRMVLVR